MFLALSTALGLAQLGSFAFADIRSNDYDAYNSAEYGNTPNLTFRSTKEVTPLLQVTDWEKNQTDSASRIFIRHDGEDHTSPQILKSNDLSLVYANHSYDSVFDVRIQSEGGEDYLTYWVGELLSGYGSGRALVYDNTYRLKWNVTTSGLKIDADIHEARLTGNGTMLITAYETTDFDTSDQGGEDNSTIIDGVFQEIELDSGDLAFSWRASDHIDLDDSFQDFQNDEWDFFHINSVEKTKAGNYLISARHAHSIYMINGTSGGVMWTLGGKSNEFEDLSDDQALSFAWQHDARFYKGNESEITFFDNHEREHREHCSEGHCSRGMHLSLDTSAKTATLVHQYFHPQGLTSESQGNVQVLENGNVFIGWGSQPSFTEHTKEGDIVLNVQFSPWASDDTDWQALQNYRAFKNNWKATPYWNPDVAVKTEGGNTTMYLSWNGATEISSWAIAGANSTSALEGNVTLIHRASRSGFETAVELGRVNSTHLHAAALDADGKVIGSTGVIAIDGGNVENVDKGMIFAQEDEDDSSSSTTSTASTSAAPTPTPTSQTGGGDEDAAHGLRAEKALGAVAVLGAVMLGAL